MRLVTTARLREAVLAALVDEDDLAALAEIESATSTRLLAEEVGLEHIAANEFVHGVAHARFINAAFAYARPHELNRFNGPGRGAWYAALATETCLAEVAFHMTEFLGRTGRYVGIVDYAEMFAGMAGAFVDLRGPDAGYACLDPEPAIGYPAGNRLADAGRARGLNGIVYPSVRHPDGTCIVALWPHAVQSVAPGAIYRLVWSGSPTPRVERIVG